MNSDPRMKNNYVEDLLLANPTPGQGEQALGQACTGELQSSGDGRAYGKIMSLSPLADEAILSKVKISKTRLHQRADQWGTRIRGSKKMHHNRQ